MTTELHHGVSGSGIEPPTLETARLILRPFDLSDAPAVKELAGAFEVADTTLNVPHPYRDGVAEAWILTHRQLYRAGALVNFAITLRSTGQLLGAIGLRVQPGHERAELGYWVGFPYWRNGYCTEAARAVIGYGFDTLGLHRIHASHLYRNPASGRVMVKLGMRYEGRLREHVRKWDRFEDLEKYGILRSEYIKDRGARSEE
jgi:[ribosomal protein S5]-alanine N-acetyltransferase